MLFKIINIMNKIINMLFKIINIMYKIINIFFKSHKILKITKLFSFVCQKYRICHAKLFGFILRNKLVKLPRPKNDRFNMFVLTSFLHPFCILFASFLHPFYILFASFFASFLHPFCILCVIFLHISSFRVKVRHSSRTANV